MTRLKRGVAAAALAAAAIGIALTMTILRPARADIADRPANRRPILLMLTSLPLVFGEDFSLAGGGSPALDRLRRRYRVVPISVAAPADLARGRLLLMAHPLPQPAEDLVALDQWVRGGGHLLLLADPLLSWPSKRPIGDPLRPPAMFMDTGLLGHWGLRLDAPAGDGTVRTRLAGYPVDTVSAGALSGKSCQISGGGFVARCRLGLGTATIVADADFIDSATGSANLDALIAELAGLERHA